MFILIFSNSKQKKLSQSILFSLSAMVAIVMGWAFGSWISGPGSSKSFMTPILSIFLSFYYGAYNALWFLLLFEIIGSLLGVLMYMLFKLSNNKKMFEKKELDVVISKKNTLFKSILFQSILVLSITLIPILDFTSYNTGVIWNAILLVSVVGLIIHLTRDLNFVVFSPFISIFVLIYGMIEGKYNKEHLYAFFIEIFIQAIILTNIIFVGVYLFKLDAVHY